MFSKDSYNGNYIKYACAEGGTHLLIALALRLPEPTKKNKSSGCVPQLHSGSLAALRFGRRKVSGRKKEGILNHE